MHVLALVANSALLNYIRRIHRTLLRGVNKTKGIEQLTVQRHGKEVGLERRGGGGG